MPGEHIDKLVGVRESFLGKAALEKGSIIQVRDVHGYKEFVVRAARGRIR